jgi:hypothetical protein
MLFQLQMFFSDEGKMKLDDIEDRNLIVSSRKVPASVGRIKRMFLLLLFPRFLLILHL